MELSRELIPNPQTLIKEERREGSGLYEFHQLHWSGSWDYWLLSKELDCTSFD
ncbi:MAG: hypothetical protein JRI27_03270 [Deltaproteobacteria bacterium]|nr:hypothetical protein [Deltaproteobacteria bacterium]